MTCYFRSFARLGAAVLLASTGLAVTSAPAHAEDPVVDIAVDVVGTRLAEGATDKIAVVKVSNHGTITPDLITLNYSARNLDYSKVRIDPLLEDCDVDGDEKDDRWDCPLRGEQIPGPGETVELPLLVLKTTDQLTEPYRTTLDVSVTPWNDHEPLTDARPTDNSDRYEVELTIEHGADLTVVAPDIKQEISFKEAMESDEPKVNPLNPGDDTVAVAYLLNQGDRSISTIKVEMMLPEGVTFGDIRTEECGFSADRRKFTCSVDVELAPQDEIEVILPVTVAKGVHAPATLNGGTVTATVLGEGGPAAEENQAGGTATSPSFLRKVSRSSTVTSLDVDQSDNSDDFAVVVTAAASGGGGEGGGLPVTGPQAGLFGGIGALVLAAGTVLFLAARRRRVVLVTPGDEKSDD